MLVYAKNPMGYLDIDGKRIYGEYFAYGKFGPAEISYRVFRRLHDSLLEVPLTSEWISKRFGVDLPEFIFTHECTYDNVSFDLLVEVANKLGVPYLKSHKPSVSEKRALRRSIIRLLDSKLE